MKKLLNTLYIVTPECYLSLDGNNIVQLVEGKENFRMPFVNLERIVCFNFLGVSPALMEKCAAENISLNFMSPYGKFLASITGPTKGNVTLRRSQYRIADDASAALNVAKNMVAAKLKNSAYVLCRAIRDYGERIDTARLESTAKLLKSNIQTAFNSPSADVLRGIEGESARMYFMAFDDMILNMSPLFRFNGRERRPPTDNVNAMLSFMYTILALEIKSALECVGLDPYVGFYHTDRSGRYSLALDMIEELRAPVADRFVLSLINMKQVKEDDFLQKEGGAVLMTDDGRKKILQAWQKKKDEVIEHPHINEKIKIGLIPYVQAQLMANYVRGDTDEYLAYLK
ncbi:MAG: type I-C CRISPR-associated endonuclease Cas1c [Clostridiaceae bacterium]|jgi:CRISPR-associated protein Cas1|nr:type I-C CRISPR-associated endonuclease Cas1c [Clostridiaceae bacterium]